MKISGINDREMYPEGNGMFIENDQSFKMLLQQRFSLLKF
jgi:hypothetical protein